MTAEITNSIQPPSIKLISRKKQKQIKVFTKLSYNKRLQANIFLRARDASKNFDYLFSKETTDSIKLNAQEINPESGSPLQATVQN